MCVWDGHLTAKVSGFLKQDWSSPVGGSNLETVDSHFICRVPYYPAASALCISTKVTTSHQEIFAQLISASKRRISCREFTAVSRAGELQERLKQEITEFRKRDDDLRKRSVCG